MANETLATDISGTDGLDAALAANLDADNTFLPADDTTGTTVNVTPRQITDAVGDTTFDGDVAGAGKVGEAITLTIQPGAVDLAMLAAQTPSRLLGIDASGNVVVITVGTSITLSGNNLEASAAATVNPSTAALTRRFMHGF